MKEEERPRLGKFSGLEQPPTLVVRPLERYELSATRMRGSFVTGTPLRLERNDGYLLCLQRRSLLARHYWVDGRSIPLAPVRSGQFLLLNLNQEHTSILYGDVDCISTYISQEALQRFHDEHGLPDFGSLRAALGEAFDDDVIRCLSEALVPAFDQPETADRLFVEHVVLALLSHLAARYGERSAMVRRTRGGLAPWQERRAKEMLLANIDGNIGLDALAAACQLSRSHFARAFKATTGTSPHRWLLARRVDQAQVLLLDTDMSLEEIAVRCGFADQSHLSRVFSGIVGTPPGAWRRVRRT